MTEQSTIDAIENQHCIHIVEFDPECLPSEATIVPLREIAQGVDPGLHRFVCFYRSKYSSPDEIPHFGGLVIAKPIYSDPQRSPNHAEIAAKAGYINAKGYTDAWGGILSVKPDGTLEGVWAIGFSIRLQKPFYTRDEDANF